MLRVGVVALLLAGCDVTFGLHHLGTPPDATDAPDPLLVTGSYRQRYVTNDESFAPRIVDRIYPPGTLSFVATLDDGTQPEVTYTSDGTFSFPIARPGQSYRFVGAVEGLRLEIQQHAPELHFVTLLAGRPDRTPIQATTVQFPYPTSTGTNLPPWIYSTGLYTQTYTGQFGPTISMDWRLAAPASSAQLGMLDASEHDQIFAVEMETDTTAAPGFAYTTIKGVDRASISQVPNGIAVIPGPKPVTRNTCVRMASSLLTEYNRIVTAAPRSYVRSDADWYVFMSPAPDRMGVAGSLWVASVVYTPARDFEIAPTFHDPFVGMTVVVSSIVSAVFSVQLPGTAPVLIGNANRRYAYATRGNPAGCNVPTTVMSREAALATDFKLAATPLDTDGQVISLVRSQLIPFSWSLTPGPAQFFTVTIMELVPIDNTTIAIVRENVSVGGQTSALLDPMYLQPGGKYMIAVTTSLGRPNVEQGDWRTLQLPFETASIWSRYFEVATQ